MGTARKPVVLMMSALGATALLAVGFASWEIRNTTTSTPASGSISADVVYDKRLKIEGGTWNESAIRFGYNSSDSIANAWLTNNENGESMSATYSFTILCPSDKLSNCTWKGHDLKATASHDTSVDWSSAASTYIDGPTFDSNESTAKSSATDGEDGMKKIAATVTIKFTWGSLFNNQNPYVYYNSQSYSEELANSALSALSAVHALDGTKFSFTITVSLS